MRIEAPISYSVPPVFAAIFEAVHCPDFQFSFIYA